MHRRVAMGCGGTAISQGDEGSRSSSLEGTTRTPALGGAEHGNRGLVRKSVCKYPHTRRYKYVAAPVFGSEQKVLVLNQLCEVTISKNSPGSLGPKGEVIRQAATPLPPVGGSLVRGPTHPQPGWRQPPSSQPHCPPWNAGPLQETAGMQSSGEITIFVKIKETEWIQLWNYSELRVSESETLESITVRWLKYLISAPRYMEQPPSPFPTSSSHTLTQLSWSPWPAANWP